ncbi:FAD-binding oxidoreductase [Streptomyces bauhiniae]|uniref:FAD-binding oxidoreductase n=1 Tax=Streptomyces bauhiniae TaxID=2340725 RepID=A0A4Z1DFF2_9ACTN|nr:FAD-dependent oxidoreductase [Streptomyces bauhiniae]TGN81307.1 FAD-binding oxidoreductase [Streptomyces bauhiniae]
MARSETLVLGTGFGGLTVATRLAQQGHRVRCLGNGTPGASLRNFGQLHSGAVYAPVLPDLAAACRDHRSRWLPLLGPDVARTPCVGLFDDPAAVAAYTHAWDCLRIPAQPLAPADLPALGLSQTDASAAAFLLPDMAVDVTALHAKTRRHAKEEGVLLAPEESYTLVRSGNSAVLANTANCFRLAESVVLSAGHHTPRLLDLLGIEHPLSVSHLPYAVLEGSRPGFPLTYRLDGDLLAVSPQDDGLHVALPGRSEGPRSEAAEQYRLAAALSHRWPHLPAERLAMRWGLVAEITGDRPDPAVTVVDLRDPPPGWGDADNLVVCLPGKWTTAWHAADRVAEVLSPPR